MFCLCNFCIFKSTSIFTFKYSFWKKIGAVISEKYVLEYGIGCLEMHVEAVQSDECALVVDDLVATGETLYAIINLAWSSKIMF